MTKKKILIIQRRPGIGDMCLFFSCIDNICNKFNNFEKLLLTSKRSKSEQILKNYKKINQIYFYENFKGFFGFFKLIFFIRSKKINIVVSFHYGIRFFLIGKLCKLDKNFFYGILKKKKSIVQESRKLTEAIVKKEKLKFDYNFYHLKKKNDCIENKIIFGIGGSGNDKKWDIENYIDLAKKVYLIKKTKIIIAGGKGELENFNYIKKKLINFNLLSLCELTIYESIEHLKNSKFYVGNDTGFMHLAGSLGINSFGLFGNTPTDYTSYNKLIIPIIPEKLDSISHDSNAMNDIAVNYVFNKIKSLI